MRTNPKVVTLFSQQARARAHRFAARVLTAGVLVAGLLVDSGCSSGGDSTSPGTTAYVPIPTARGVANGALVTKSIGPAGGVITAADAGLTITVPAGALSSPTEFTIQAITNTAVNGVGTAYRIIPSTMTFSVPITLAFRYTDAELAESSADGMGMGVQDQAGLWWGIPETTVDTVGKQLLLTLASLQLPSPSTGASVRLAEAAGVADPGVDYSKEFFNFMEAEKVRFKARESGRVEVLTCLDFDSKPYVLVEYEALTVIPHSKCYSLTTVPWQWAASYGSVSRTTDASNRAIYTAPSVAPADGKALIQATNTFRTKRKTYHQFVTKYVTIDDGHVFLHVVATYNRPNQAIFAGAALQTISDKFEFDISFDRSFTSTAGINITNEASVLGTLQPNPPEFICKVVPAGSVEQFTANAISGAATDTLGGASITIVGRFVEPAAAISTYQSPNNECRFAFTYPGSSTPTGLFVQTDLRKFTANGHQEVVSAPATAWTFTLTRKN